MSKVPFCHFGLHSSDGERIRERENTRNKDAMSSLTLQAGAELLLA